MNEYLEYIYVFSEHIIIIHSFTPTPTPSLIRYLWVRVLCYIVPWPSSDVCQGNTDCINHAGPSIVDLEAKVQSCRLIDESNKVFFFREIMNLIQLSGYLMVSSYIQDEIYDKNNLCLTRRFIYKTVLSAPNILYPKPRLCPIALWVGRHHEADAGPSVYSVVSQSEAMPLCPLGQTTVLCPSGQTASDF